ncbi:MAG: DUF4097 family beta strand repeat-containing protein [Gemmatimonadaceae bacterium]
MDRLTPHFPGTIVIAGALLLLGAPNAAHAQRDGDRIDTTVVLGRGGAVHLGLVSGEIRVVGSQRPDVHISATLERGRLERSFTPGRASITARAVGGRMGTGRYEVSVPIGTRVTATSVSGSIDIRATRAEVTARTTSGDITVHDAVDRIETSSVSGEIDVRNVSGRLRIETVSGDISVSNASGDASVESVSGTIALRRSQLDGIRASAVSGSISYEGPLSPTGSYRINTHSGSVVLTLPANVGATLELETFSGRISSDFPLTLLPGEGTGRRNRRMEFTLGSGGARVIAGAFSGSITIRRGGATGNRE